MSSLYSVPPTLSFRKPPRDVSRSPPQTLRRRYKVKKTGRSNDPFPTKIPDFARPDSSIQVDHQYRLLNKDDKTTRDDFDKQRYASYFEPRSRVPFLSSVKAEKTCSWNKTQLTGEFELLQEIWLRDLNWLDYSLVRSYTRHGDVMAILDLWSPDGLEDRLEKLHDMCKQYFGGGSRINPLILGYLAFRGIRNKTTEVRDFIMDLNADLQTFSVPIDGLRSLQNMYSTALNRVIKSAPPTTKDMVVYAGKEIGRLKSNSRAFPSEGLVKIKSFLSTSLNCAVAEEFVEKVKTCCLFVIHVPQGTPCVFVPPLSEFEELEVLFAQGAILELADPNNIQCSDYDEFCETWVKDASTQYADVVYARMVNPPLKKKTKKRKIGYEPPHASDLVTRLEYRNIIGKAPDSPR
jgi:hypothetical protein